MVDRSWGVLAERGDKGMATGPLPGPLLAPCAAAGKVRPDEAHGAAVGAVLARLALLPAGLLVPGQEDWADCRGQVSLGGHCLAVGGHRQSERKWPETEGGVGEGTEIDWEEQEETEIDSEEKEDTDAKAKTEWGQKG